MDHRHKLNCMVKIKFFLLLFIFFFNLGTIYANEKKFTEGKILYENKFVVDAEYLDLGDGSIFIRDANVGYPIPKSKVVNIVDKNFYDTVKSKSKWNASLESFYRFEAGSHYQYEYNNKGNYFLNDEFIRPLKIGLLLLTAYTYSSALQANQKLGDSIYGLNSSDKQDTFQQRNREFVISAFLTTSIFLGSSIIAYIRFGKDSSWNDLRIPERAEISIDELQNRIQNDNVGKRIDLKYEMRF
ncbi:hypothetical protein LEP1GSC195_3876 [Leptospira wolbachii serovar Codice str. CDC]|uniref:Uncharacterized protein n=1 Tax=Leptospira wolbachii serovar Codice str. CDC TaxID=1218599 RepID=R8ZZF4_9LEPT|nr:hypothetical protein [Leptospira wolbachii]EOQ95308.1 hypothetical protein LEP1GSC195_3876 [Leptospira wolbachii serovar Codice str. CDC]